MGSIMRPDFAFAQEAVNVESNLVYGTALDYTGTNVSLTLDVYYVNSTLTNRPVVLLTHGGGFGAGDKGYTVAQGNFYPDIAAAFCHPWLRYFFDPAPVVARLFRRLHSRNRRMAVEDVMTALGWIRAHSAQYGIDATKVLIAGDSAGGGLAVNASYRSTNMNSFLGCISLWGGVPPPYGTGCSPGE